MAENASKYKSVLKSSEEVIDIEAVASTYESIQNEMKSLNDIFKDSGIRGLRKALRKESNRWKTIPLNFAVTGSSGAGKSAFINALRDVSAGDKNGAAVGVTETTKELTSYKHPKHSNFIVWDMPGIGTPNCPREHYLESVKFDRYDFYLILSRTRFTDDDLWLAKEIQKQKKRFYFVRTSIDNDICNEEMASKRLNLQQEVMQKVSQECQKNLEAAGIDDPHVFLVNNLDRTKYDFVQLELHLLNDCDSLKVEAMALCLSVNTLEIFDKKRKVLEERIIKTAMEIACIEDNYEEQRSIFEAELSFYREQFSLDKKELSFNKDILNLTDANLKEFQDYFKEMSTTTEHSLKTKISLAFGNAQLFMRMIVRLLRKWGWLEGSYSESILQFSILALLNYLEKVHKKALEIYNLDVQKGLVETVII